MRPAVPHRREGRGRSGLIPGLALMAVLAAGSSPRAEPQPQAPQKTDDAGNPSYCANVASAAADARFRWQADTLNELGKDIESRIARLEAKRAEYETWLRRRQDFLAKANESVIAIYARMKPEAAALQLATMGPEVAAAILVRIDARIASAILNEMDPARAALLTSTINDTPRPESLKPDALKPDAVRPDAPRGDLPLSETPKMPPAPAGGGALADPKNNEKTG